MHELIKEIEKQGLTRTELLKGLEAEYDKSKKIKNKLTKKYDKFIKEIDYDDEFDAGFSSIFSMRNATQDLESYISDREMNAEGRPNTVWSFALEHGEKGFEMEKSYYKYKAYTNVLERELSKLSYEYND